MCVMFQQSVLRSRGEGVKGSVDLAKHFVRISNVASIAERHCNYRADEKRRRSFQWPVLISFVSGNSDYVTL